MITLEIGQLYGMNSIKEVLDAVKELQDSGMTTFLLFAINARKVETAAL